MVPTYSSPVRSRDELEDILGLFDGVGSDGQVGLWVGLPVCVWFLYVGGVFAWDVS